MQPETIAFYYSILNYYTFLLLIIIINFFYTKYHINCFNIIIMSQSLLESSSNKLQKREPVDQTRVNVDQRTYYRATLFYNPHSFFYILHAIGTMKGLCRLNNEVRDANRWLTQEEAFSLRCTSRVECERVSTAERRAHVL